MNKIAKIEDVRTYIESQPGSPQDGSPGTPFIPGGDETREEVVRMGSILTSAHVSPSVRKVMEEGLDQSAANREVAVDELAIVNCELVKRIATRYEGRGIPRGELIEAGASAMTLAATTFEPAQGVLFSSYASWWIKQAMKNAVLFAGRVPVVELAR